MPQRLSKNGNSGRISGEILTKAFNEKVAPSRLTNQTDVPFILCFKYPLQHGYTFSEMSMNDVKEFQRFLDKISKMTVQQVDSAFKRKPDTDDRFGGMQVQHYKITEKFRIHVVLQNGRYKVIRLDPNHKFHK